MTLTVDTFDSRAATLATKHAYLLSASVILWIVGNELLFSELFRDTPSVFISCRTNLLLADCEMDEMPHSLPREPVGSVLVVVRVLSAFTALGLVWLTLSYHSNRQLADSASLGPLASTTALETAVVQSSWLSCKATLSYPHVLAWSWSKVLSVAAECLLVVLHAPPGLERLALALRPAAGVSTALRTSACVQLVVAISMLLRLTIVVRALYFARSSLVRPAGLFIRRFIELPGSPQLFMVKATFRERPVHSTLGVFVLLLFVVSYLLRMFETYTCALLSVQPEMVSERTMSAPRVRLGTLAGVMYSSEPPGVQVAPDLLCAPLELADSIWLVLISSLTVGYGDVAAETHFGRAVSVVGTLLGILLTGIIIAAVIGFLRLSYPEQAVGQLLARSGSDKRFRHAAAVTIQAMWRHFYAEHSFLTWVSGAGGGIAVRPVSGRFPLEIAARRAVFDWRVLRKKGRRDHMNANPALQRHVRTQTLLVNVETLRAEVGALLEDAQSKEVQDGIARISQLHHDKDPTRHMSEPMKALSQAVSLVGSAAAAQKRAHSGLDSGTADAAAARSVRSTLSPSPGPHSDGGSLGGWGNAPTAPRGVAPMLGALGKSVSGFQSTATLATRSPGYDETGGGWRDRSLPATPSAQASKADVLLQLQALSKTLRSMAASVTLPAGPAAPLLDQEAHLSEGGSGDDASFIVSTFPSQGVKALNSGAQTAGGREDRPAAKADTVNGSADTKSTPLRRHPSPPRRPAGSPAKKTRRSPPPKAPPKAPPRAPRDALVRIRCIPDTEQSAEPPTATGPAPPASDAVSAMGGWVIR
jgi:hypothetical protein